MDFPDTQLAVQLIGPGELRLAEKSVSQPGGHLILAKVEANGLCFSDMKLLKQFSSHARKTAIASGFDADELRAIPSYVPEEQPTVPGHECVVRIVAVGEQVKKHHVGERLLVQTDYRHLPTTGGSCAAFGYNFEGGLQEYVVIDERISANPETGESYLLPVGAQHSASAISLVEPWACVESSYATPERRSIKPGGRLLIYAEKGFTPSGIEESFSAEGAPAQIFEHFEGAESPEFDDIIYFGASREMIEVLGRKLAANGIMNVATAGHRIGQPVELDVGRIHYGNTRWIGTNSARACDSYATIPASKEIRDGDHCVVVGAGGPMGQMQVVRLLCSGAKSLTLVGTDMDDERLAMLAQLANVFAIKHGARFETLNSQKQPPPKGFNYLVNMVPSAALVARAIEDCGEDCLINIFAGIPAGTFEKIDLDALIAKRCYMFGSSGSRLDDMKTVLKKVERGELETNCSVAAVSGMAGAIEGISAVEKRTLPGKIIVYPSLHRTGLIPLPEMLDVFPSVARLLRNGMWTKEAEEEFLRVAS